METNAIKSYLSMFLRFFKEAKILDLKISMLSKRFRVFRKLFKKVKTFLKWIMGLNKEPWNKDRIVGKKRGFTLEQVHKIRDKLKELEDLFELALFYFGIDSMKRGSDFLRLKVKDVMTVQGEIIPIFYLKQKKTKVPNFVALTRPTQKILKLYIESRNLESDDYLFSLRKGRHISTVTLRLLIKKWATYAGIKDTSHYSGHSLRRTKFNLYRRKFNNIKKASISLGHLSMRATEEYAEEDEMEVALDLIGFEIL